MAAEAGRGPAHPHVKAMRDAGRFTLPELVASDADRLRTAPTSLTTDGKTFIASEPYDQGTAPQSSRFTDADGNTVLALGFPGERLALELTLDDKGRIVRETLVAPNHLIQRTFRYPEHGEG
ncbi:hypothetical protein ACIBU0_33640 [Streptomyces sp. NPDC049627]|uniref:hypothetical protein n=1 Tax=Streptomyces sp. NPDC049627 TaxID=3365595 RepID=UPI00379BB81C